MASTGPSTGHADRLADEAAILDAIHRYCRGVDRADAELTRSAYHPDATDDHGAFKGPAFEFAEHVNEAHASRWSSTMHVVANHVAAVDGDVADAETYVIAFLHRLDGTHLDVVGGRYVDRFERRGGDWRIARRAYVCEWSTAVAAGGSLIDAGTYRRGSRDRTDTSYDGLLGELGASNNG